MKRILFLSLAILLPLISGCGGDELDPTPTYTIRVSPGALAFPAEGGTETVTITTDAPSVKATCGESWLQLSVQDKVLTVTAGANTGKESRSGKITVTAEGAVSEVSVIQSGKTSRPADDPYPSASYALADKAIFVKEGYSKGITAADPAGRTFTVSTSSVGTQKPEVGQKLIMNTPTSFYPDGLLAEVTSVTESGGSYTVHYKDIKLEEAFTELRIDETSLDLGSSLLKVLDPEGKEISFTRTRAADEHSFHIGIPEASWPVDVVEGLEFSPKMDAVVTLTLQAIIADAELYTFNVNVKTDLKIGGTLAIGAEGKAVDERKPLFSMVFSAIPVGPVLVTPFVELAAVYYVSGKVSVEATAVYHTVQTHGVHYDINTGWSANDFSERNNNGEWEELSIAPKLEGSIAYGLGLGPYVGIYGKVVAVGVSFDVLQKETVSEAFNFLGADVSQYADMSFVQHLQRIDYTNAIVAAASFNVELVGMDAASFESPEFTICKDEYKILPSVDLETFSFERTDEGMQLSIDAKNPHLVGGLMYALLRENGNSPESSAVRVDFKGGGPTLDDLNHGAETVNLTALLPLDEEDPDMLYADIMYLTEYSRTPVVLASIEQAYDDKDVRAALISILRDLYKSHAGDWEGCNWFDGDIDLTAMKNIRVSRRNDQTFFKINLPEAWSVGSAVAVGDHSKDVSGFGGWEIIFEDGATDAMTTLSVLDSHFLGYYIARPHDKISDLTINSPLWTRFEDVTSRGAGFERLDLSRTPLEKLELSTGGISVSKRLVLKECKSLKKLSFDVFFPETFDVTGCTALEEVHFDTTMLPDNYFLSKDSGTPTANLVIENSTLKTLDVPVNYKEIWVNNCTFEKVQVSGNSSVDYISLRGSKGQAVEVKDCAKLSTLGCPNTDITEFTVENLPAAVRIDVENNEHLLSLVPDVFDEIKDRGGSVAYDIRYSYTDDGSGTIEYEDNGYGFWYEGEPECGYHGKEPPQDDDEGYVTHPGESAARAAFRKCLQDLYRSRKGEWEGCNWLDGTKALHELTNVSAAESQSNNESFSVTIPVEWQFGADVLVKKHNKQPTSQYPGGEEGHYEDWRIYIHGERQYNSFTISDPRCYLISAQGEAKTFAVHSNSFFFQARGSEPWKYRSNEIPSKIETLDLRGCGGYELTYELDYEHVPKVIKLRRHDGKDTNADARVTIKFTDPEPKPMPSITIEGNAYLITVTNATVPYGSLPIKVDHLQGVGLFGCTGDMIYAPENVDYLAVGAQSGNMVNSQLLASGIADIREVKVQDNKTILGVDLNVRETVTVDSCPLIENVYGEAGYTYTVRSCLKADSFNPAGREVRIQDCPALTNLYYPDTYGPIINLTVDSCPNLKEVRFERNKKIESIQMTGVPALEYVNLTKCTALTMVVPSFFEEMWSRGKYVEYEQRYDYRYNNTGPYTNADGEKFDYTDKGYGFYFSDEPGRGYHKR